MAGWYDDDEPNSPWSVCLYLDSQCTSDQFDALSAIFLGRAGGTPLTNFARAIGEVHRIQRAQVELSHVRRKWAIRADRYVNVAATQPVESAQSIACGIPGLDHPGEEVIANTFNVDDKPLEWASRGRCGFSTTFNYSSAG